MRLKIVFTLFCLQFICTKLSAQQFPSADEKIPFLCTFSNKSDKDWGDDDFVQVYFFIIPQNEKNPVYVRVFDADLGGQHDEIHGEFNSKTRFSIYGGKGAHSNPDAQKQDPTGNFKSGIELAAKTFGKDTSIDNKWYTFGPFNPVEGELQPELGGYVFKLVIQGMEGDDGNLYRLFLSSQPNNNKPIEGGNAFTYEYSLRLADTKGSVSHLYPFVANLGNGKKITTVKIKVFDFDDDGILRLVSNSNRGELAKSSGNGNWIETDHKVVPEEINTSLDIQFIKQKDSKNNNIVVNISNQYGEGMAFFSQPIGGVPKYKFKISVKSND
ncbi:MAG: hypothetical protein ACXVC6_08055 [Bacteroidia bacterium]